MEKQETGIVVELLEPAGKDTAALDKRRTTIVQAATDLVVDSPTSLAGCERMVLDIKAAEIEVGEEFDEGIAKAFAAHKHQTTRRKKYLDPLAAAKVIAVGKGAAYRRAEDELRRAEEARLRKRQRQETEDARLAEAAKLEEAGRDTEAEAVINEPIRDTPVALASTLPKSEVPYRKTWSAEVTGLPILIGWAAQSQDRCAYLEGNMTALNAQARATKGPSHIPGVEFRSKTSA